MSRVDYGILITLGVVVVVVVAVVLGLRRCRSFGPRCGLVCCCRHYSLNESGEKKVFATFDCFSLSFHTLSYWELSFLCTFTVVLREFSV
jgi:hypothetical protein